MLAFRARLLSKYVILVSDVFLKYPVITPFKAFLYMVNLKDSGFALIFEVAKWSLDALTQRYLDHHQTLLCQ